MKKFIYILLYLFMPVCVYAQAPTPTPLAGWIKYRHRYEDRYLWTQKKGGETWYNVGWATSTTWYWNHPGWDADTDLKPKWTHDTQPAYEGDWVTYSEPIIIDYCTPSPTSTPPPTSTPTPTPSPVSPTPSVTPTPTPTPVSPTPSLTPTPTVTPTPSPAPTPISPLKLLYSTYLGGDSYEHGYNIEVDSLGCAYVTGSTWSDSFPIKNAYQEDKEGSFDSAFFTKFSSTGSSIIFSSYLGGSGEDKGMGLVLDSSNNIYIIGTTASLDFPVKNPYQASNAGSLDIFITKVSSTGSSLLYSTYLGGSNSDGFIYRSDAALDSANNIYITGYTDSSDFPIVNPYQASTQGDDAFIVKLSPTGSNLLYSTYLGGGGFDTGCSLVIDTASNIYITGISNSDDFPIINAYQSILGGKHDAFVSKFSSSGTSLYYSSYLGGEGDDIGSCIVIGDTDNPYITGYTDSINFPTENPYQSARGQVGGDAYITKFASTGSSLIFSTYFGGDLNDVGRSISLDSENDIYIGGLTDSINFPTMNPMQSSFMGGDHDAFVSKFSSLGSSLVFSTYLGGSGWETDETFTLDTSGNMYIVGQTNSDDFPVKNAYQESKGEGYDVFVSKLGFITPTPTPP